MDPLFRKRFINDQARDAFAQFWAAAERVKRAQVGVDGREVMGKIETWETIPLRGLLVGRPRKVDYNSQVGLVFAELEPEAFFRACLEDLCAGRRPEVSQSYREELERALWEVRHVPDGFTRHGYAYDRAINQFILIWLRLGHRPRLTLGESDIQQVCWVSEDIYDEIMKRASLERRFSPYRLIRS